VRSIRMSRKNMVKILFKRSVISGIWLIILLSINSCSHFQNNISYNTKFNNLQGNVEEYLLGQPLDIERVERLLDNLNDQGFWPYIDYRSEERGRWQSAQHVSNLLLLAKAYRNRKSPYYKTRILRNKFNDAYDFWVNNDFQSPNWWYDKIGIPMVFAPAMILMQDHLSYDQMAMGIKILDRSYLGMWGQNKVWLAGNVLYKSILLEDMETVSKAVQQIKDTLGFSNTEGLQSDMSFHQHGPQMQFGNYGLAYAWEMLKWENILRGTSFELTETDIRILKNFLLEGLRWVVWKGQMDISACGRHLFVDSPKRKADRLTKCLKDLEEIEKDYGFISSNTGRYNPIGNKHFWRSDFHVHRSSKYYFSVKMCSSRVIAGESINGENKLGRYLGDGAAFLYQTGKEYENIFPLWDWRKIPGTTVIQNETEAPVLRGLSALTEKDFVGGVSDGEDGIAVMDYSRDGLEAKKAWFMLDDKIFCMGNGITSKEAFPVATTINQSVYKGNVIVKNSDQKIVKMENGYIRNPYWILHDGIGYFFPYGGDLRLESKIVEGSWHRVASRYPDKRIFRRLFKLWIEHGVEQENEKYCYVLVPNANRSEMDRLIIQYNYEISNDENIQMVVNRNHTKAAIAFCRAGEVPLYGGIEVDKPCLLLIKKTSSGIDVCLSDPTQKLDVIQIVFNTKEVGEEKRKVEITLPSGRNAGNTVRKFLKINLK
jgi:chondroitin AC lyase